MTMSCRSDCTGKRHDRRGPCTALPAAGLLMCGVLLSALPLQAQQLGEGTPSSDALCPPGAHWDLTLINDAWRLKQRTLPPDFSTEPASPQPGAGRQVQSHGVASRHAQPLSVNEFFSRSQYSHVSCAEFNTTLAPTIFRDAGLCSCLPWETHPGVAGSPNVRSERVATWQEIALSFQTGPVKRPPYALRGLAHWAKNPGGEDLRRAGWQPEPGHSIVVTAEAANRWMQGSYEVWLLRGNCRISQGPSWARCREAVLWIAHSSPMEQGRAKVIAYLEGDVTVQTQRDGTSARVADETWLGRFISAVGVDVDVGHSVGEPSQKPAIYQRGIARRSESFDPAVRQAQHTEPAGEGAETEEPPPTTRRIRVFSRSDVPIQAQWYPNAATNQGIAVINSGVNMVVDGLRDFGSIDVSADRMVIWTVATQEPGLSGKALQDANTPLEIYMEGDVVFRQGEGVIYADRMYYNVNLHTGAILWAETPAAASNFQGLLQLKAEILQQTNEGRVFAENTFVTSSRIGKLVDRIGFSRICFEDVGQPAVNPFTGTPKLDPETGQPAVNPFTGTPKLDPEAGQPAVDHQQLATAKNDFLYLDGVPVFYWPTVATEASDSTYGIRLFRCKSDKAPGGQFPTEWNCHQLLGIRNKPAGTDWDVSLDQLQEQCFGHRTTFPCSRNGLPRAP